MYSQPSLAVDFLLQLCPQFTHVYFIQLFDNEFYLSNYLFITFLRVRRITKAYSTAEWSSDRMDKPSSPVQ